MSDGDRLRLREMILKRAGVTKPLHSDQEVLAFWLWIIKVIFFILLCRCLNQYSHLTLFLLVTDFYIWIRLYVKLKGVKRYVS